jgi:hypothetical protein
MKMLLTTIGLAMVIMGTKPLFAASFQSLIGSSYRVGISHGVRMDNHLAGLSQKTYTVFSDGHAELVIWYTDGTHYTAAATFVGVPVKGSLKHREWVWRNNEWMLTVEQYY